MSKAQAKKTQVMHIISGLHVGGAEMMLAKLLANTSHSSLVVSLNQGGDIAEQIREQGVEVVELQRTSFFSTLGQLMQLINKYKPSVIQSWLYRADLIAGIAGKLKGVPVIWNVRQAETARVAGQAHIWLIQRLNAVLSYVLPKQVVYCAQAALRSHESIGFSKSKSIVIANGIDTDKFIRSEKQRVAQRQEWNVGEGDFLIGMVGRFDPLKNHGRFFSIINKVKKENLDISIKAVLIGRNINADNNVLKAYIEQYSLQDNVLLVEETNDVVSALNGLDMHILTSDSEGWPNVLGEAMSVALPCAASDVGDVKAIMQNKDLVFSLSDEQGFVKAVSDVISKGNALEVEENRLYIQKHYSLEVTVKQYDDLYSTYLSNA